MVTECNHRIGTIIMMQSLIFTCDLFAFQVATEMSSMWAPTGRLCNVLSLQAVGLLLPWWVEHAVPAMLTFIAAAREAKQAEHAS